MKIYAFTPTRANSKPRAALLNETCVKGRKTAGIDFYWHVIGSGLSAEGRAVLTALESTGQISKLTITDELIGQHVAWNMAFKDAVTQGADYFLRIDDDCEFVTKRWLAKLVKASICLNDHMILSPKVRGLKHPPEVSNPCELAGYTLEFLRVAIGGICRLHPMSLLNDDEHPFYADVRKPLASGDATGIANWCRRRLIPMAYLQEVRVKHNTLKQETEDPVHFTFHDMLQHVPYIPELVL